MRAAGTVKQLTTIKLSKQLVTEAREASDTFRRSISSQVEYWAEIGRAFESMPGFTFDRVRAALEGRYSAAALTDDEATLFDDLLGGAMDSIQTPSEKAYWVTFKHQPNTDL